MEATPPKAEEFEISIFGPGKGECILIHLGNNEWCVVDSCRARGKSDPVAVEYLKSFNNNALERVKLVVATHWHDDHIGGLTTLLKQAEQAEFCCSMAMKHGEFLTLIEAAPQIILGSSGVEEFAGVLDLLKRRGPKLPKFAVANRNILSLLDTERPFPFSLESLSPSDSAIVQALAEIAAFLPQEGRPQRRIPNKSPNRTSVVLWAKAGPVRALLGADLEQTSQSNDGWTAILSSHQDNLAGEIFKVPHHGSQNADNTSVWGKMLKKDPVTVVTPFSGGTGLPQQSDLKRLSERTSQLYCTVAGSGKSPNRDPSVERQMKEQLAFRRVASGQPGHVRVRWSTTEEHPVAQIETFNGAYHVAPSELSGDTGENPPA